MWDTGEAKQGEETGTLEVEQDDDTGGKQLQTKTGNTKKHTPTTPEPWHVQWLSYNIQI